MRSALLSIVFIFGVITLLFPQNIRQLSREEKNQIDRLSEMANVYINDGESYNAGKAYSQIAFVYWKAGRPREAIDNFISSADLFLQKNKFEEVKNTYSNIGVIYTDLEELEFALEYFNKSLEIRRKIGKKSDVAAGLVDVAYILQVLKFNDDAIEFLEEGLAIATEIENSRLILDCYQLLSLNYEQKGNIRKSQEFAGKAESYQTYLQEVSRKEDFDEEIIETKQEVAKSEEEKRLAAALYELQQIKLLSAQDSLNLTLRAKEDSLTIQAEVARARSLEIDILNKAREVQDLQIKEQAAKERSQRLIIIMIAGGLLLMVFLAIVMLRANRARKKANVKLEKQNKEIAEKSEQLGNALKKIAHQNQNITQSINYAKGIQTALLPKPEQLKDYIEDSFILFKPRDIVSGDFYWFREIDSKSNIFKIFGMHRRDDSKAENGTTKKFVISAVDCTGHGVPGAFMSMIGFNLLDEITNKGINRPDLILEELHRGVRFTLKQRETNNQDGMDMAICVIDTDAKKVEFAGAKNPLVYIQDGEVFQIKGDKNGIGGKSDEHKFELHTIDVSKPTWFYLFSDGFIDQFGGDNGRKFMIKKFRELLFQIHDLPMAEQKIFLDKTLKDWVGTKYNQIDDVLVIGFKLDFLNHSS
ncbi:MAG: tetratricopeptide repeat protein [Salinivirgaceae bacterium]|nr:tetratricopeptide repeat protein [Salinivirgaceae bacterium]